MRILVICDARVPVPPKHYGGTERIAHLVCEGLAQRGHVVDLIAARGSRVYSGRLYPHVHAGPGKLDRIFRKLYFQLLSLWAARKADVVLTHGRIDYLYSLQKIGKKIVFRLGNPVDQAQVDAIEGIQPDSVSIIGISRDQLRDVETQVRTHVFANAVPISEFMFHPQADEPPYLAFLGRLTENKGVHLAIEAAKATGYRLKIAGNVPTGEEGATEYFETRVKPFLDDQIEWIGPVDHEAKQKLLGGAKALLFPIQWREPFGIVMPESLACGCPVIAWKNGSVPEVIRDGETGFVVESLEEMIESIQRIDTISRIRCRQEAEERFSPNVLVECYLKVLQEMSENDAAE